MATTNLLQWNPTAVNQETDSQYAADSTRAGGAVDPTIFLSVLGNKAFFQWSTYLTALFTAFANKGFTTSDSNISTLTAQCTHFLTTADVLPSVQLVTYASSITLNAAQANGFYIVGMTGNLTIAAINGLTSGQQITMYYQQDSTGGRTVSFPGVFEGAAQPDPTANSVSVQVFGYDITTSTLRAITPLVSNTGAWFTGSVVVPNLLTTGSFTLTSPGSSGQVLTNVGGVFVPRASVGARVDNSNGWYITLPDGTIEQGGTVSASAGSGHNDYAQSVPFAINFPTAVLNIQVSLLGLTSPGGGNKTVGVESGSVSLGGFTALLAAMVYIGGGGTNLNGSEVISWFAVGY